MSSGRWPWLFQRQTNRPPAPPPPPEGSSVCSLDAKPPAVASDVSPPGTGSGGENGAVMGSAPPSLHRRGIGIMLGPGAGSGGWDLGGSTEGV